MNSSTTYAYQKEKIKVPAWHHDSWNVMGLLGIDGEFHCEVLMDTGTSVRFIEFIEKYLSGQSGSSVQTVVVLDNASIHKSKVVQACLADWESSGLKLLYLPPYCPERNPIEILWKRAKHEWRSPYVYSSPAVFG